MSALYVDEGLLVLRDDVKPFSIELEIVMAVIHPLPTVEDMFVGMQVGCAFDSELVDRHQPMMPAERRWPDP